MNKYLHEKENGFVPPIDVEAGWQQMKRQLDAQMPEKKKEWPINLLRIAATVLLLVAGLWYYPTNDEQMEQTTISFLQENDAGTKEFKANNQQTFEIEDEVVFSEDIQSAIVKNSAVSKMQELQPANNVLENSEKNTTYLSFDQTKESDPIFNSSNMQQAISPMLHNYFRELPANAIYNNKIAASLEKPMAITKHSKLKKFNLSAGIMLQSGIQQNAAISIAPLFRADIPLTKRTYLAAEIAPWVNHANQNLTANKTIPINSFTPSISHVEETINYERLKYLSVPVMAGYKLSPSLSIEAGLQTQVLLSSKTSTETTGYNYDNRAVATALELLPLSLVPPVPNEIPKPRSIDYQFKAGIQYTAGNVQIGLHTQAGFSDSWNKPANAQSGYTFRKANNGTLSLQVKYRLGK